MFLEIPHLKLRKLWTSVFHFDEPRVATGRATLEISEEVSCNLFEPSARSYIAELWQWVQTDGHLLSPETDVLV